VLEAFITIRNRLTALKKVNILVLTYLTRSAQDTSKFIRTQDVMSIYNSVVKQGELTASISYLSCSYRIPSLSHTLE